MRILLDTHAFLWFVTADAKLSQNAELAIRDGKNDIFLSVASAWEIAIKVNAGKLPIPLPLEKFIPEQLAQNRIAMQAVELKHVIKVAKLPLHHKDPFDRLLAVQAMTEDLTFISIDTAFDAYGIKRLW